MNVRLSENFRGNVRITIKGEVVFECSKGFADLANERPNNKNTRFASASAGKVFVAVGILKLIEEGRIRLDDTLSSVLPIDLHQIDPEVTVRQLLTHTSGVPDYFDEEIMSEYEELWKDFPNYKIRRNSDLFPLFIHKPMQYPKGTKFRYNNSGFVILASIIEQVTQKPFDAYLQEVIFDRCHMISTGYYELDRLPSDCANNYIHCDSSDTYRTNIFSVDAKGTGAGGAFITAEDISKFWDALIHFHLLSKNLTEKMLSVQSQDEDGTAYGYGIWIRKNEISNQICYYFQGYDPGVSFISEFDPLNQTEITLMSNFGDNVWKEISDIRRILYKMI